MAEEIRPSREVARGFISTSRPGRTALGHLSEALGIVGATALGAAEAAVEKEVEENAELLNSPLITEEEINEIQADANFPITKIKAENRRGALRAEEARAELENALNGATDAVDTRRILVQFQQGLLEKAGTVGEQAGIREYYSEAAPRFLAEAAKRRKERTLSEQRETDNRLLLGASRKGTDHMFEQAAGMIFEESLDFANGDVTQVHSDVVTNAIGRYAENEHSAPDMIGLLKKMLKEPDLVRPRDRPLYTRAIKTIESDAIAGDVALTYAQRKQAAKTAAQAQALDEIRRGPRGTLSEETMRRVREHFDDPLEAEKWILAAQEFEGKPSVIGSAAYDEAFANLKERLGGGIQVLSTNELGVFRSLAGSLSPHILDNEDQGRAVLLALADEATDLVKTEKILKEQVDGEIAAQRATIFKHATKAERLGRLDLAKRLRAGAAELDLNIVRKRERVQQLLFRQAEIRGFDIRDDLINLLE